ncbi:MAG TPA: amidohydrolase [Phycisphaerae bacterium]|nr:amidohydrolase [Phycisphaerae bacterium]
MNESLLDEATGLADQLRGWRRHLHAHPELSGQEQNTARFVASELRKLGYEPVERVGGTFGLTAELAVNDRAPAVALRADMDALAIQEETGLPFASQNPGVMHACGHDAHMAMLLGAAKLLQGHKERLGRSVRLIFQPHEEIYPGGASAMIAAGVLENVESIFGLHIWSELAVGELGTRTGPFMAGLNDFEITLIGKGGHAAMPEQCIDPVVVAAQVILALQTVVSRSIAIADQAVVSVTQVEAGTAFNIIPERVTLRGTIRMFNEAVQARLCSRVRELSGGVARAYGAEAQVRIEPGYPVLVNDPGATERALRAARQLGLTDAALQTLPLQGGAEDFAYYCRDVPGVIVFVGTRNEAKGCTYPHHHPRFDVDEEVLPVGAALLARYALEPAEDRAG